MLRFAALNNSGIFIMSRNTIVEENVGYIDEYLDPLELGYEDLNEEKKPALKAKVDNHRKPSAKLPQGQESVVIKNKLALLKREFALIQRENTELRSENVRLRNIFNDKNGLSLQRDRLFHRSVSESGGAAKSKKISQAHLKPSFRF